MTQTGTEMLFKSCLTDKPLDKKANDRLEASEYAQALCRFIRRADTPVTIGIQGGWGSGKTSLITLMQEDLSQQPSGEDEEPTICVLVNAWEHSLFQSADSKSEVALSLLNGLANGVKSAVEATPWLEQSVKSVIQDQTSKVETALKGIKTGLRFLVRAGAQIGVNLVGGGDISKVSVQEKSEAAQPDIPPIAENVSSLRKNLGEMIKKITYQSKPVKVVFFIDDLDRVSPPTAVEILDITKNIFDIPNCVFVLAIDYDVVVKGLEEKFGEKNEKNEREFRQYFDKIIQIPFTMPIGAYVDSIGKFLNPALARLGHKITEADAETVSRMADDACLATGGIPRSIKRIINTLSLLQHIAEARDKKKGGEKEEGLPDDLEARFIIVAMHINFPEIARRLTSNPNFTSWKPEELDLAWKLDLKNNKAELDALGKDEYFNDPWEKVVYCLCASSPWLKSQSRNVSHLLNNLLKALEKGQNVKQLSEESVEKLKNILDSIKVVSIDEEANQQAIEIDNSSVKTDAFSTFCIKLHKEMAREMPQIVPPYVSGHAKRRKDGDSFYRTYSIDLDAGETSLDFDFYPDNDVFNAGYNGNKHRVGVKRGTPVLEEMCGEFEGEVYGSGFWLGISEEKEFDDFENMNPKDYVARLAEAYKLAQKVSKKFESMK